MIIVPEKAGYMLPICPTPEKVIELASSFWGVSEKVAFLDNKLPGWDSTIKDGGVIFDVGCSDGKVGVVIAAKYNCSLI